MKIDQVAGRAVPLVLDDIDTDRIIPARYLRCVTFDGLGEHVFEDDRVQASGHPFDDPKYLGATVLIAGRNFGCGSSREHAPQALIRWGIQAIVGESFAEIFFGNCTSLGVPCVRLQRPDLERLAAAVAANPQQSVTVDLIEKKVHCGADQFPLSIPESARAALTTGQYDFLAQLLDGKPQIRRRAAELPYLNHFTNVG